MITGQKEISRGFTIWLTGLPGAGKTTLANLVRDILIECGMASVEILDGDIIRTHLSRGLGFSKEDRDTNVRRIGWVCQLLTKHGVPNVAAAVSPYRAAREEVRRMVENVGGKGSFVEVFVNCPVTVCEGRDPKGLYRRARQGEIHNFSGVSDPYESPEAPEVIVHTAQETPDESARQVLNFLEASGLVKRTVGTAKYIAT
jgi:adenylylsulfate kinase